MKQPSIRTHAVNCSPSSNCAPNLSAKFVKGNTPHCRPLPVPCAIEWLCIYPFGEHRRQVLTAVGEPANMWLRIQTFAQNRIKWSHSSANNEKNWIESLFLTALNQHIYWVRSKRSCVVANRAPQQKHCMQMIFLKYDIESHLYIDVPPPRRSFVLEKYYSPYWRSLS